MLGRSVAVEHKFEDGKGRQFRVNVYRSDTKTHMEHMAFRRMLENFEKQWLQWKPTAKAAECPLLKSRWLKYFKGPHKPGTALEPDHEAIDQATRYFGFFSNITTMPCTAQEAIEIYGTRDLIEKTFKAGKSTADMTVVRSHREDTTEDRFIISFVAMTILSRLYDLMKESETVDDGNGNVKILESLALDKSFEELKNHLEGICKIFDGRDGRRGPGATEKQHDIAIRMGFLDLYSIRHCRTGCRGRTSRCRFSDALDASENIHYGSSLLEKHLFQAQYWQCLIPLQRTQHLTQHQTFALK